MATSLSDIAEQSGTVRSILEGPAPHTVAVRDIEVLGWPTSDTSVRRYRKKINWSPAHAAIIHGEPDVPTEEPDSVDHLKARIEGLQVDNRRLFRQNTKLKARGQEYIEAVYRAARDAAENVGSEYEVVIPEPSDKSGTPEGALAHMTDWQGGKKTESYDFETMESRVRRYVDKVWSLTEIQRKDHPVDKALVLITGDMVEGVTIFPGQVWELDGTLYEQMFRVADLLEWSIRQIGTMFTDVQVVAEYGNHGRIGKPSDGIKKSDNIDRIVYGIVRDRLLKSPMQNLSKYQFSGDWYQNFTFGNYRAMAIHGDEIKQFGGNLPAYGIMRKANSWASGVVEPFTDLYIGHYHQSMQLQLANGGNVFMTGSTESHNEFAQEFVAATGRPSQRLNFVDLEKGRVTAEYRVWLD